MFLFLQKLIQSNHPIQLHQPAFLALKDPTELRGFGLCPEDVMLNIHQTEELSSDVHLVLLEKAKPHLAEPTASICAE